MFVVRSAFWLTLAFLVFKPGFDIGASALALKDHAVAKGQQVLIEQVISGECTSLECASGKAVFAMVTPPSKPSVDTPMQDSSTVAPLPRPRPHWMG